MTENRTFVSRAGNKLQAALTHFQIDVTDLTCADLGCSTGGFTDCLLQNGAAKVYAVDTAYGELAWKLRNDPRVVVVERQNALYWEFAEKVDFVSVDVGWTRQELIIKKALEILKPGVHIVSLIKPHYEAEKQMLTKGKLKAEFIDQVVSSTLLKVEKVIASQAQILGYIKSPVVGDKGGNVEFLMCLKA